MQKDTDKMCELTIREAVEAGFSPKCAVRYAAEEICAEIFLETGKEAHKQVRRMQNVLHGDEIYEHPRKIHGWFSFPCAWKRLFWENMGINGFCTLAGMSNDSPHRTIFANMEVDAAPPAVKGAKIFLYCIINKPFGYANAVAGRLLAGLLMAETLPLFFAGFSQGLCGYRKKLSDMMQGVRTGDDLRGAFENFVELWKEARAFNIRKASEIARLWLETKKRVDDNEVLEFYMSALNDNKVRESAEWARFAHIPHEETLRHIVVLEDAGLAIKRKSGYEIRAMLSAA